MLGLPLRNLLKPGSYPILPQGNLLRGINCHLVWCSSICGTKDLESFAKQALVTIFLYFNLKQKALFETMLGIYGFHLENHSFEKIPFNKLPFSTS